MNKKTAVNLALLALVTVICLGMCEAGTRLLLGSQVLLFPRYQTFAHYGEFTLRRLRPNFQFWHTDRDGTWKFVTNGQGFRSYENFDFKKPSDLFRVIALGDSTTEGLEVHQSYTYTAVLERYLRHSGKRAEVLNTGISGFGTAEELIYLENEGIKYDPDAVVLGFYANDFYDNVRSDLFRLVGGKLTIANKTYIPGVRILDVINAIAPLRWLSENSYFYSFALNTIWEVEKRALLNAKERERETEFTIQTSIDQYQIQLEIALLHRLYVFCHSRNIILIIVDIPQPKVGGSSERDFLPSIPPALQTRFRENSDALILSEDLLAPYRGLARFFGLNGMGHPNEFTDLMLGAAIGRVLDECAEGQRRRPCTVLAREKEGVSQ